MKITKKNGESHRMAKNDTLTRGKVASLVRRGYCVQSAMLKLVADSGLPQRGLSPLSPLSRLSTSSRSPGFFRAKQLSRGFLNRLNKHGVCVCAIIRRISILHVYYIFLFVLRTQIK